MVAKLTTKSAKMKNRRKRLTARLTLVNFLLDNPTHTY